MVILGIKYLELLSLLLLDQTEWPELSMKQDKFMFLIQVWTTGEKYLVEKMILELDLMELFGLLVKELECRGLWMMIKMDGQKLVVEKLNWMLISTVVLGQWTTMEKYLNML